MNQRTKSLARTSARGRRFAGFAAACVVALVALAAVNRTAAAENTFFTRLTSYFGWSANTSQPVTNAAKTRAANGAANDERNLVPPNDDFSTAIALGNNSAVNGFFDSTTVNNYQLGTPGTPSCFTGAGQTATTAPGRDVVYSFTAPAAGNYSFRAQNTGITVVSGGNLVLYLVDGTPTGTAPVTIPCQAAGGTAPVAFAASNRNTNNTVAAEAIIEVALNANQQVFLVIDEAAVAGTLTTIPFTVEVNSTISEVEPNNTVAAAQTVASGVEGRVSNTASAQDLDYFSLGTPADGSRLFAIADSAASNGIDLDMRINNAGSTLEGDDANNDTENGGASPNIAGLPLTAANGPFAIQIDTFGSSNTSINEPYRLAYVVQPPSAQATAETTADNSTIAGAQSAANNYFAGTFDAGSNTDVYATIANAGDLLHIGLDSNPNRNLATAPNGNFDLLDAAGNVIFTFSDSATAGTNPFTPVNTQTSLTPTSPAESGLYRVPTTGIYYVRVSSGSTAVGPYLLSISRNGLTGGGGAVVPGSGTLQFGSTAFSGSEGATATVTVTRTNGNTGTVTVNYSTGGGSATGGADCATAGVDYVTTSGTLTFAEGVNSQTFTVTLCPDAAFDPNETFNTTLSNPTGGATVGTPNTATVTINDATQTLQFNQTTATGAEGATVVLTVTRSNGSAGTVTVDFATADGTATGGTACGAGIDYVAQSGTLTFVAADTSETITITLCGDTPPVFEPSETFTVTLSNPTGGAAIGANSVNTVTITDATPSVQFNPATYTINESAGTVTLTVTRTNSLAPPVSVDYATANGTAIGGAACGDPNVDFVNTAGTLTFAANSASQTFTVTICDDAILEQGFAETFTATLSNPGGGAIIGANPTATVNIVDNEAPPNDTCASAEALTLNDPIIDSLNGATNNYTLGTPGSPSCFVGAGQNATTATGRDRVYSFVPTTSRNYNIRVRSFDAAVGNLALYLTDTCPTANTAFACQNTGGTSPVAPLASNRNTGTSNTSEEISCQPLTAGTTYFVIVDEATAATGNGSYQLEVTPCNRENAANNTPSNASSVFNQSTNRIEAAGDIDFFRLGAPVAGSRLFALVDTSASANVDTELRATTATDTIEADDDDGSTAFGGSNSVLAGTPLTGAESFLRVNEFGNDGVIEPYQLSYVVRPPAAETAEVEPNNTLAQANTNSSIGYYSGVISSATDVDLYAVTIDPVTTPGVTIFAALDNDPLRNNTPFNGNIELLDAGGNVIVVANDSRSTTSVGSGAGSLTATVPDSPADALTFRVPQTVVPSFTDLGRFAPSAPQTYYIRVTGTAAGDYLLSIANLAPRAPTAATVEIGGRVTTSNGQGIRNVIVTLTDANGATRSAVTGTFGYYRFADVAAGQNVIVTASSKRYNFGEPSQVVNVTDEMSEINFVAFGLRGRQEP